MTTFTISDIHGAHRALKQCIERSGIDKEKDRLICLGDTADSWREIKECFNELLTFKNLIYIMGNHDLWTWEYYVYKENSISWRSQGGEATIKSFGAKLPDNVYQLLSKALPYFVDENNRLYVHGGFSPMNGLGIKRDWQMHDYCWDRDFIQSAIICYLARLKNKQPVNIKYTSFENVFLGHTPTLLFNPIENKDMTKPLNVFEVWDIDTGAGYTGQLTIMNVETKEFWQSDSVKTLYPGEKGR